MFFLKKYNFFFKNINLNKIFLKSSCIPSKIIVPLKKKETPILSYCYYITILLYVSLTSSLIFLQKDLGKKFAIYLGTVSLCFGSFIFFKRTYFLF